MRVWRFVGGSHLAGKPLSEPEGARPEGRFASFADFAQIAAGPAGDMNAAPLLHDKEGL
jgi:hypothetical protein